LRAAAADCQFTNYEDSLIDQLLAGLKDEETESELIRKEALTWNSVIKEILAREQSRREAHDMDNESSSVHRVKIKDRKFKSKSKNTVDSSSSNEKSNPKPKCDRCKLVRHLAKDCKTKSSWFFHKGEC
jgi:capsular polysaccharide biosynthesis protein